MTQTMTRPRTTTPQPAGRPARNQLVDARAQSRPAAQASSVHLTGRGRFLLVASLVAVLLGAFSLGRTASQASPAAAPAPAVEVTTVQVGDSLWSVAQRVAPDNDTRQVVAQIRRLNDLTGSDLKVGQQLLLPVAA